MGIARGRFVLVLAGAATVLALAGCAGGGGSPTSKPDSKPESTSSAEASEPAQPSAQSKADACTILTGALAEMSSGMKASMEGLQSNPAAAATELRGAVEVFVDAVGTVTNEEMVPLAQKAGDSLTGFVTVVESALTDPNAAAGMLDSMSAMQDDLIAVGVACS